MSAVPEGFKEYYHGPQDIPPEHRPTKVDGIYTADPKKDPTATMYDEITFDEALRSNLKAIFRLVIVVFRHLCKRLYPYKRALQVSADKGCAGVHTVV